jgi:nucleotide-binding universal stress UspA family protein
MFESILLVGDGKTQSLHAARKAGNLARAMHCSRFCISVTHPAPPEFLGELMFDQVTAARIAKAEAMAKVMCQEVGDLPCSVDVEILESTPRKALPLLCETHQADLVVMGANSVGLFQHLRHAEPEQLVSGRAGCTLLLVP